MCHVFIVHEESWPHAIPSSPIDPLPLLADMAIKDLAQNVAIAGFTALGVEKLTDKAHELERMATGETSPEEFHKSAQHALLLYQQAQYELLQKIADALAPEEKGDIEESIVIPVYPQSLQLSRFGRPHSMLYVKSSINLFVEAPNLGQFTVTGTAVGWNQLDLPDGVRISIPSGGSPTTALYRVSVNAVGTANPSSGGGGGGGNVNLNQVGGTSFGLGQNTMANSLPVALASNQGVIPENLSQVGGASFGLGQNTKANSISMALASDMGNLPTNIAQYAGVTPGMSGSDGQAGANVPLMTPGIFNGSTVDRLQGYKGAMSIHDWIRYLILQGQGFTATTGIVAAPAAGTFPVSFFSPATSTKTKLIYQIRVFCSAGTTYDLRSITTDPTAGWTGTSSLTPQNSKLSGGVTADSTTIITTSNTVGQALGGTVIDAIAGVTLGISDFLSNGEVKFIAPGVASGFEATAKTTGTNNYGLTIKWVEF